MSACNEWNAIDRAELKKMSAEAIRERLREMMDSEACSDADSRLMLALTEELEERGEDDYIRTDVHAALRSFRENYLPFSEQCGDGTEQSAFDDSLPAFIAAFSAGKKPSAQETEEIRKMIEAFRKEL